MAVATTCFKWAELLETQFDKSWIELDTLLLQLEEDEDYSWVDISTYIYTYLHISTRNVAGVRQVPAARSLPGLLLLPAGAQGGARVPD